MLLGIAKCEAQRTCVAGPRFGGLAKAKTRTASDSQENGIMKELVEPTRPLKPGVAGFQLRSERRPRRGGYTLVEVVFALSIMAMVFAAVMTAYVQGDYFVEQSGFSLAAQTLCVQTLEQAKACVWDPSINKNELTNLTLMEWTYNANTGVGTGYCTNMLDLPISGTNNVVIATNFVTVQMFYLNNVSNPPVKMQMITVNTVWASLMKGVVRVFTNTTATLLAPDNRDVSSL